MELSRAELRLQALPNADGKVFGSRNPSSELGDLLVEEAVSECIEDFAVHDVFEVFEVDDEASGRIDLALDRNFQRVVMAVPVGIIAFAEDPLVLLWGEVRVVVVVRGGKFSLAS